MQGSLTAAVARRCNPVLDRAARRAQRLAVGRHRLRPYALASDIAALACIATAAVFAHRFGGVTVLGFAAVFVAMRAVHRVVLAAKARWLGSRSRSLLQDTLVLLPAYAVGSAIVGHSLPHAFDVAALVLATNFAIVRLGCFGAGCCYGRPSVIGVNYPAQTFVSGPPSKRALSCRARGGTAIDPKTRVLPLQLLESLLHGGAAAGLWIGTATCGVDGLMLPRYLALYGAARFALDFVRPRSSRPRIGRWSEAQVVALIVVSVTACILAGASW